jgi:uncharacterized protein YecT (DUF1311 family)
MSLMAVMTVAGLLTPAGSAGANQARAARLAPPGIRESFTVPPCTGKPGSRTTLELEGCAEHEILKTDKVIDALEKTLFHLLGTEAARGDLIAAARAWLNYRHSDCHRSPNTRTVRRAPARGSRAHMHALRLDPQRAYCPSLACAGKETIAWKNCRRVVSTTAWTSRAKAARCW